MAGETPGARDMIERRKARRQRFDRQLQTSTNSVYGSGNVSALATSRTKADARKGNLPKAKARRIGSALVDHKSTDKYYRDGGAQPSNRGQKPVANPKKGGKRVKEAPAAAIVPRALVLIRNEAEVKTGVLAAIAAIQGGSPAAEIQIAEGENKRNLLNRARAFLDQRKAIGELDDDQYYAVRLHYQPKAQAPLPPLPPPAPLAETPEVASLEDLAKPETDATLDPPIDTTATTPVEDEVADAVPADDDDSDDLMPAEAAQEEPRIGSVSDATEPEVLAAAEETPVETPTEETSETATESRPRRGRKKAT